MQTGMNSLMLLYVRELFERFVAVGTGVLAHIAVYQRVLRELLRRRERLQALATLVSFLFHTMRLLGMALHVRLVGELLQQSSICFIAKLVTQLHNQSINQNKQIYTAPYVASESEAQVTNIT